jgi:hypothetical protein
MNEPLHPLTLSEILDRTAQLYRSRFLVFLGIAAIPAGIMLMFAAGAFAFVAWVGANARHGTTVADILVWVFLSILMILMVPGSIAAAAMGEAAITDATARFFLGESLTIRSAYLAAWSRGWRYIGLLILQGLMILGLPAVVFVAAMTTMIAARVSGFAGNDTSPVFGIVAVLLFFVLGAFAVWMLLRVCLAFPACVVEQTTAWNALKRCTGLSEGTRARIFLLYLLGLVLNQILAWALTIPIVVALAFIPGLQGQAHAQTLGLVVTFMMYGAMFVVRALTKPVYGIALTLFYFDQRMRKEGFDIEWMMLQAGMVSTVPAAQAAEEGAAVASGKDWVVAPASGAASDSQSSFETAEAIAAPAGFVDSPEEGKA